MLPCFSYQGQQAKSKWSSSSAMPKRLATSSRTRTPSGITSVPMPSPGMTAMRWGVMVSVLLDECVDLCKQLGRSLLGDVVAAVDRPARHAARCPPPRRQHVEAGAHRTVLRPEQPQRAIDEPAGLGVEPVVLEVDPRRGPVVLADRDCRAGTKNATLVLGQGLWIERLQPGMTASHDAAEIEH